MESHALLVSIITLFTVIFVADPHRLDDHEHLFEDDTAVENEPSPQSNTIMRKLPFLQTNRHAIAIEESARTDFRIIVDDGFYSHFRLLNGIYIYLSLYIYIHTHMYMIVGALSIPETPIFVVGS
jgi:hypothetical protein